METYFTKFPTIEYLNTACLDITRNVSIRKLSKRYDNNYYLYNNDNNLRSDQIAEFYYDDPHADWLILLANQKIDPYYGWYLNSEQLQLFLIDKYGSIEIATNRIKHWELNYDNTSELLPATYEGLPDSIKKYFIGQDVVKGVPTIYRPNIQTWTINTNKMVQYEVVFDNDTRFIEEELIQIKQNPSYQTVLGRAEFITANNTSIICKNIINDDDDGYYLVGRTSGASAQITSSSVLKQVIPLSEIVYWRSVSYLEWETFKNDLNKDMDLIDKNALLDVAEEFRKLLKA